MMSFLMNNKQQLYAQVPQSHFPEVTIFNHLCFTSGGAIHIPIQYFLIDPL